MCYDYYEICKICNHTTGDPLPTKCETARRRYSRSWCKGPLVRRPDQVVESCEACDLEYEADMEYQDELKRWEDSRTQPRRAPYGRASERYDREYNRF